MLGPATGTTMRKERIASRLRLNFAVFLGLAASMAGRAAGPGDPADASLRFELSFPASVRGESADGRVFVVIARQGEPEPRLQFGKEGGQYRSTPFFGEDVEALKPGQRAVVGSDALGYPVACLADL